MESFIRYLYEYKNEQRIRNVGFVKVDQDENGGTLQIHGRGTFLNNADIRVYLVYMDRKKCCGILMGELHRIQSILSCRLVYDREEIEQYTDLETLRGVVLETNGQGTYAAVWDEGVLPFEQLVPAVQREACPSLEEAPEELEACESEDVKEPEKTEHAENEKTAEDAEDAGGAEMSENVSPYRKITREDMTKLPRKNWYLANNSFLLHGYYNYRHLLLISRDGETYIGVPGIYHHREEMAADSFGFAEFVRIPDGSVALSQEECDAAKDFGYWCRKLERE